MHASRKYFKTQGFTLVEVTAAMAVLSVVALGALSSQYQAVVHSRISKTELAAVRAARMLLEDWRSAGGDSAQFASGLGGNAEGYQFSVDGIGMLAVLSDSAVYDGEGGNLPLRQINVTVKWRSDCSLGSPEDVSPSYTISTYIRDS